MLIVIGCFIVFFFSDTGRLLVSPCVGHYIVVCRVSNVRVLRISLHTAIFALDCVGDSFSLSFVLPSLENIIDRPNNKQKALSYYYQCSETFSYKH